MRFRKLEIVIVGLTLAFVCFLGGYFTGMKSSVAVVSAPSRNAETQQPGRVEPGEKVAAPVEPSADATEQGGDDADRAQNSVEEEEQLASTVGIPRESDGRININTASRGELTDLPGIGSVLAGRIVDYRTGNGPFSRIEDIRKVTGIGEKRYEAIKDRIKVES